MDDVELRFHLCSIADGPAEARILHVDSSHHVGAVEIPRSFGGVDAECANRNNELFMDYTKQCEHNKKKKLKIYGEIKVLKNDIMAVKSHQASGPWGMMRPSLRVPTLLSATTISGRSGTFPLNFGSELAHIESTLLTVIILKRKKGKTKQRFE